MTDDTEALIKELRTRIDACDEWAAWNLMERSYVALEDQAKRIGELVAERDALAAQIAEAIGAWWAGAEDGDTGVVYTDDIEDAMDAIWVALSAPASDALNRVRERAWEEGHKAGWGKHALTQDNPYRIDPNGRQA